MATVFIALGTLFFLGHFLNWIFQKTKIPDLLILIGIGYLAGPVFSIIQPNDFGKVGSVISTAALIIILYEGGINLKARDLLSSSLPALGLTILGFSAIGVSSALVSHYLMHKDWLLAILLGVGVGSTSSAIVIPLVKSLSISQNTKTILSLESAFTDVIMIVIFLVIIEGLLLGSVDFQNILLGLGPKTIISGILGASSGLVWSLLCKLYPQIHKMTFSGEFWALITYGIFELSHLNGAIGVLALGFILANINILPEWAQIRLSTSSVSETNKALLSATTFLLRTFFFIYLGLLVQFSNANVVILAFIICILIFLTRYLATILLFRPKKYSKLDVMISVAMGPRGLGCAVLATLPLQKGLADGQWIQDVVFAVIPLSIIFTSFLVILSENKYVRNRSINLFKGYSENTLQHS